MDGLAVWLERELVFLPNRLRSEKPVLTITRYSGIYVYRRLVAMLPGCSLLAGTTRAMAGRGRRTVIGIRPVLVRRFLLEYL